MVLLLRHRFATQETGDPDATPTLALIEEHFAPGTQVGIDDLAGDLPVPDPGGRS